MEPFELAAEFTAGDNKCISLRNDIISELNFEGASENIAAIVIENCICSNWQEVLCRLESFNSLQELTVKDCYLYIQEAERCWSFPKLKRLVLGTLFPSTKITQTLPR